MSDPVIRAEALSVVLDGRTVLDDISLEVVPGEVLALVGPNGAGKSTLLSVLSGERVPTSGQVLVDDRDVRTFSPLELARRRSVLTQDNSLSFPFRVIDVITMGRAPWTRTDEIARDGEAITSAASRADVTHLAGRRFTELSGGERARVSLARVLAQDTAIVFLDEPTAALDLRHQEDVLRIARDLALAGRAVVVVVHDLSLAGAVADRVALLSAGRLVAVGAPSVVLTADAISNVYGLPVRVVDMDGRPLIVPQR
ncbi:heme ABC transporter ATP-binding protein [Pseudolysinimonas yzui]|uniref:Hemin import ATP-binding protein HmuV n=1 Tax=Pseudolysinimonas yzui TaxID=2708254 RepID=A0A8J3GTL9_9MICO|nr:heme ABC transporter ATP-binding protein [Pseudolysinimonas yzui]GHF27055.1 hemin import ATP-binding protein HmuV [Pseudolysinimonas yzui]